MADSASIQRQIQSLLNPGSFTTSVNQDGESIGNANILAIGKTTAQIAEVEASADGKGITSLVDELVANNKLTQDAFDHNLTYTSIHSLLSQMVQNDTSMDIPTKITFSLILIYIQTHLFKVVSSPGVGIGSYDIPGTTAGHCGATTDKSTKKEILEYALSETTQYDTGQIRTKFYSALNLLIHAQLETNYNQMYMDAVLRIQYVLGSFRTLFQVVQQHQTTIDLLRQLSDYVNEQVVDYSSVYERLNTLIDTHHRRITFQTGDMQTLERWQFWCIVVFWGLVVFFGLMVMVDYATDISRFTADMDTRLKHAASAASQATHALVGPPVK